MRNKLNKKITRLLFSHGIFLFGRSAFAIFMNIFVWNLTKNIQIIAKFNIIYALTHTAMFVVFAETLRKGKSHLIRRIGLIGFTIVYFLLFYLNTNIVNYLFLLAFLIGIFNGMYWLPYQLNRLDLTYLKNRGSFTGFERSTRIFVDLVAPITGGFIISSNLFVNGYAALFLMGSVFFLLSFIVGNVEVNRTPTKKVSLWRSAKKILSYPQIAKVFISEMIGGFTINGSLIKFILPLLIFEKTGTEFKLGGWLSFFALLAILSSLLVGKKLHYKQYDKSIIIGGTLFILAFVLLYKMPILTVFIIFGAIKELTTSMTYIPRRVYSENLLYKVENYRENRIAYLATREIFNIGIGMTSSYCLLLFSADLSLKNLTLFFGLIIVASIVQIIMLTSVNYSKEKFDLSAIKEFSDFS